MYVQQLVSRCNEAENSCTREDSGYIIKLFPSNARDEADARETCS
jgi:hypothetical protein